MKWIPLKEFLCVEAQRLNMSFKAIQVRFYRGKYPHLKLKRVNPRVVYVQEVDNET